MTADIVLRGGLVIDGTGGPARIADVAVTGNVISEVGDGLSGDQVIDASGAWVMPGFIDPHTHMDAQLFWDPSGQPSLNHGVTTAFTGSCGFGIAPCREDAEEFLLRCLESVEEIPFVDMQVGVPFGWTTFVDYMDALSALPLGLNVATLVPHSPLRHSILGKDAATRVATPEETAQMSTALREALRAGAFGFTTSRGPNHVDGDGQQVPSRAADDTEMQALVACCAGRIWQINVAAKGDPTGRLTAEEVATYAQWTRDNDTTLTWTPLIIPAGADGQGSMLLANQAAELTAAGTRIYPQVCPMPLVTDVSLTEPSLLRSIPIFEEFASLVAQSNERTELLRDETWRRRLRDIPEDPSSLIGPVYSRWVIAASDQHPELVGYDLSAVASSRNQHPVDVLLDTMLDDNLTTVVQVAVVNIDTPAVQELVLHPSTLIGLGDSGAHVRSITNFSYPTTLLHEMVLRDQTMALEHAVHELTGRPASILGLSDRGVIAPGSAADICVIDPAELHPGVSELVHDLPAGGGRLVQRPRGMRAVLVNGTTAIEFDRPTDQRSGQLLRHA